MKYPRLRSLVIMLFLGIIYCGWFYLRQSLTNSFRLDGTLGVFLGLYIASYPAGNMLDMLLFMSADVRENILTTTSGRAWLALNALVFLVAWLVIFIGITAFVRRTV